MMTKRSRCVSSGLSGGGEEERSCRVLLHADVGDICFCRLAVFNYSGEARCHDPSFFVFEACGERHRLSIGNGVAIISLRSDKA